MPRLLPLTSVLLSLVLLACTDGKGSSDDPGGAGDDGGGGDDSGGDGGAVPNTPPTAPAVSLAPDAPTTTDDLVVSIDADATDADGDTVAYSYRWAVDGVEAPEHTTATVPASATARGQTWSVAVIPDDGVDTGEPGTAQVVVVDTAPEAQSVVLAPTAPLTSDDILATPSGTDVDGDPLTWTYAWTINGVEVPDVLTDTLPASATSRGDVVAVTAIPSDGELDGSKVDSEPVTVVNGAPTGTEVVLDPGSVYTNDTLTATASGTDPEDDALSWTYAWFVDGVEVAGETGDTLAGTAHFDRDQEVYVVATPSDGTEPGTPVTSETVTVLNTPPTAVTVAIDPALPLIGQDLVCTVDAPSTDEDGDTINYSFSWTVDGVAYGSATSTTWPKDTVPGSDTAAEEVWECTATPSDGTTTGPSGTDSVTVLQWEGERTFTPCGASGRTGPDQSACDTEYTGTTLEGEVVVSGGIQEWVVPFDGDYVITAYGAQGAAGDSRFVGGWGALAEGTVTLAEGDVLSIAVGQLGVGQSSGSNGGGGGGTFVVDATGAPLVVAGGGGGTRTSVSQDGCDAVASEYGVRGSGSSSSSSCSVKTSGLGTGGSVSGSSWGSGGAGFNGNGGTDGWGGTGGYSWSAGLLGGTGGSCGFAAAGGFGGGGSGNGCYGGGGGGGYSGGDGGRVAGGGGSYVDSGMSNTTKTTGYNEGDGWVVIDVPE